jgi:disulfide bond formation protein DsbB
MFTCTKDPEKIVAMASLLILGGVVPLAGAILVQFGLNYPPCHFCLLQRYPYLVVAAMGILALLLPRGGLRWRFAVAMGIFALFVTGTLGLIHTGIESGYLVYKGGCVAQAAADSSLAALRASIASAPLVACDAKGPALLGISMASWNSIWAFGVILLALLQQRFEVKRYASRQ